MARYNVDLQDNEGNAYQIMANPDSVAEFSPAANRENIRSGETHRIIFGKIMKYLSEVGNAAYVGLANNCTTTVAGFALDARQGKELMDRVNELNRDLTYFYGGGAATDLKSYIDTHITAQNVPGGRSPKSFHFRNDNGSVNMIGSAIGIGGDAFIGFFVDFNTADAYSFRRILGADTVLKKLGSGTVSISNYIFNFNVSTSGNGSSSGNQGRSGKSEFVLDTRNYDVLTIGSYTIEGDGAHAAWNPRDCVALSVTINGIKTAVGEGGRTFDVKNADSATIVATFGTNGNPDYGTWATITVSNITLG